VLQGAYVTVVCADLPHLPFAKASCVVSKKVSSQAVVRNKIQRRLREIVRPFVLPAAASRAIVIRAKKQAAETDIVALRADLEPLLSRVLA
jgi:ribonuclease P protein component